MQIYRKIHTRNSLTTEPYSYLEDDIVQGYKVIKPVNSPVGYLGLSCVSQFSFTLKSYDARFPSMYRHMFIKGA